jgi:ribosomal protein L16 Arg81 hydroxylase
MSGSRIFATDVNNMGVANFYDEFHRLQRPVIFKNSITSWRARNGSRDYLTDLVGNKVILARYCDSGKWLGPETFNFKTKFGEATRLIFLKDGANVYITQVSISKALPELLPDIPQLRHLTAERKVTAINLWVSGNSRKTGLHYDTGDKFLVQIKGRKRILLFPPKQSSNLYPALSDKNYPHVSRVDVFCPDKAKFPQYETAETEKQESILEPGDTLYLPRLWWHAVETIETSISVNFWWH